LVVIVSMAFLLAMLLINLIMGFVIGYSFRAAISQLSWPKLIGLSKQLRQLRDIDCDPPRQLVLRQFAPNSKASIFRTLEGWIGHKSESCSASRALRLSCFS
jgi:hypothetical protein